MTEVNYSYQSAQFGVSGAISKEDDCNMMNDLPVIPAWHFVGDTLRDGSPVPPDGEWLEHDGDVVLCKAGFHASRDPFDALEYAPGNTLCRVEVAGRIVEDRDKLVASRRRIIARVDFEPQLAAFARWCALEVIHLWNAPEFVRRYLETGDKALMKATEAAARADEFGTAQAAAMEASWAAAMDAAWAAARVSAKTAVRAAARADTMDSVKIGTWAAARSAKRTEFNRLVAEAFGKVLQRT